MSLSPFFQILTLGAVFLGTLLISKFVQWRTRMAKLNSIPTVGSSGIFSSYISARRFNDHAREIITEGYKKYPGRAFKIPLPDRWEIIVSGQAMMEDIKKASDLDLSFNEAVAETLQTEFTLGRPARIDAYHIDVVRTPLTRNLGAQFHVLRDEIKAAFADEIPAKESEWSKFPMLYTVMKLVSRTSNRFFVGLPVCRDPDYIRLNIEFTIDAFSGAKTLQHYPSFLKPLIRQFYTDVPSGVARATRHLEPIIKERLRKEEEYGTSDWPGKPNDLISWFLDEAQGERRKDIIYNVVSRVLIVNFAAIHTTSITLTNCLFELAAHPELAEPLRNEVEACVNEQGWTKAAMGQMWKLDSFMKETQRLSGVDALTMSRMALRDFTFSDGTVVPAGTIVSVASYGMHRDDEFYEDPETFKAFRFSDMRIKEGEGFKHQMVAADSSYGLFGGGKHMCPGRFFAVNELKALLAHVLLEYNVKFENGGGAPEPDWRGSHPTPDNSVQVMFQKRAGVRSS